MRAENRPSDDGIVDFSEYLQVLRRRIALIVVLIVLGAAGGFLYERYASKTYAAQATVQVRPEAVDLVAGQSGSNGVNIDTEEAVLASLTTADAVRTAEHSSQSASDILANAKVLPPGKGNTLTLEYKASNAKDAASYANAFVNAYLAQRGQQAQGAINKVIGRENSKLSGLQSRLSNVQKKLQKLTPNTASYVTGTVNENLLMQQINQVQSKIDDLNTLVIDPGSVVTAAQVPTSPSGLSKTVLVGAGALIGLVLGLLLAFIRDRRDDRLRHPADATRLLSVPVLGLLPRRRGNWRLPAFPTGHPATRLALGAVVARLAPLAERDQMRTILVTSPTIEDAAEATAIDIALALADSGMRVSLITARPASVQSEWLPSDGRLRVTDSAALRTGGDLLNPERVRMVFGELREYSDFVLIVGAPVLRSPDSLVLADRADGVLVAVDKRQRAANVQRACDELSEVGSVLLGAVLRGFVRPVSGSPVAAQVSPVEEPAAQPSPVSTPTS